MTDSAAPIETAHVSSARACTTTVIELFAPDADTHCMTEESDATTEDAPVCIVCARTAVTIDRKDDPMCAKHAALFVTMDHRDNLADRARIVR
jgi:hypothetical protein